MNEPQIQLFLQASRMYLHNKRAYWLEDDVIMGCPVSDDGVIEIGEIDLIECPEERIDRDYDTDSNWGCLSVTASVGTMGGWTSIWKNISISAKQNSNVNYKPVNGLGMSKANTKSNQLTYEVFYLLPEIAGGGGPADHVSGLSKRGDRSADIER